MRWHRIGQRGRAKIGRVVAAILCRIVDLGIRWGCRVPSASEEAGTVGIAAVNGIGDFFLWLPYGRGMAARYAGRRRILLAHPAWAPLARFFPEWDEVWAIDPQRLVGETRYRWRILQKLRAQGISLSIQAVHSPAARRDGALIAAMAAPVRFGAECCPDASRRQKGASLDCGVPVFNHETDPHRTLLAQVGGDVVADAFAPLRSALGIGDEPHESCFVVFPGAGWPGRRWPPERFAVICRRLIAASGWRCLIAGGQDDFAAAQSLELALRTAGDGAWIENLAGRTSIHDLVRLVARARFVLSNETGVAHMAAAMDVPSVCVIGGGHYGRFMPYPAGYPSAQGYPRCVAEPMDCFGCDWRCRHPREQDGPARCIAAIGSDAVWTAVADRLGLQA